MLNVHSRRCTKLEVSELAKHSALLAFGCTTTEATVDERPPPLAVKNVGPP